VSAAWKASVKKGCSLLLSTYESSLDNAGGANQHKETSLHSSVGEKLFFNISFSQTSCLSIFFITLEYGHLPHCMVHDDKLWQLSLNSLLFI
jgi:hypothetical protein